ncbi:MAG: choice-of-anchor D domain-containing protein [Candidatus Acidiferrales bacterium]
MKTSRAFAIAAVAVSLTFIGISSRAGDAQAAPLPGHHHRNSGESPLSLSETSMSFGTVTVGSTATQSLAVSNGGRETVNISQATLTGTGFTFVGGGLTGSIQAGQSATVQIQFAPQSAGAVTGSLTIIGNASNSPLTITLSGTGEATPPTTGTPTLTVSPSAAAFGNVTVGQNSAKTIQLANSGTAALTISGATLTGTGFSMSGLAAPMSISAGQSMSFSVQFAPAAAGSVTGSISIANDATGSPVAIALTGTGTQAGISASPASASFGNVTIGASNSQPIMLTNAGNVALTISAATVSGTGFSITGAPTTIAVGGNASFNAVFTPTTSGSVTGSLSLTSNAPGSPLVIPFTGTGVAASYLLGTNPASLSFGNITLNGTSSLPVTLTNNGNSNITISGVTVSGSGFSTSGVTSGLTLQPSQTATLNVAFAPTAAGAAAGSITVTSNASNSPATISLTGSSYAVSLAWQASSSSELAGYNVFRGTSSGSYTQLNASPITGTAYTDSTVADNQTYFYVVTAVNTSGVQSANSNQTSVSVP